MLELPADDPLRRQIESIPIKRQRSLQIINTESNDRDPRLHSRTSAPFWKCEIGYVSEEKVSNLRGKTPRASKRRISPVQTRLSLVPMLLSFFSTSRASLPETITTKCLCW